MTGESPHHQANHADLHLSFAGTRLSLVVAALNPTTTQPGEYPLHHPTKLDGFESRLLIVAAHDFDLIPAVLANPSGQPMIVVLVVRPQLLQTGKLGFGQLGQNLRSPCSIIRIGRRHRNRQQQAQGIHDDMPLPAVNPFASVKAMRPTDFAGFDGLAVNAAGAGGWLTPRLLPRLTTQSIIEGLPDAVIDPLAKVVVNGPPRWKIVRQSSPNAAVMVAIEDRVDHGPEVGFSRPSER